MGIVQSQNLMTELKFTGMQNAYEPTLATATQQQWSHTDFLDQLLQAEYEHREQRKTKTRIQNAKLRCLASFEDFDYTANRSITKTQVKELASLSWLGQGRCLLLIGQTGVGKTFIAQAAGLHACQNKKTVIFMNITTLLENFAIARTSGNYLKMRDKLSKPDLLIIDDFGLRKLSATEAQDLCEVLEERAYSKATLITTQLPTDHWAEVIEDPVIADAIIDRVEPGIKYKIKGESYRKLIARKLDSKKEQK